MSGREALLQGLQQGGDPSPMDRIFSGRLALAAVDHITGKRKERCVFQLFVRKRKLIGFPLFFLLMLFFFQSFNVVLKACSPEVCLRKLLDAD